MFAAPPAIKVAQNQVCRKLKWQQLVNVNNVMQPVRLALKMLSI